MLKQTMSRLNRTLSRRFDLALSRASKLYPWQVDGSRSDALPPPDLPEGAADYLRLDHPRLAELRERYAAFGDVTAPFVWTPDKFTPDQLLYFRGDNPFVWQLRDPRMNALSYGLTYYHLKSGEERELLAAMSEDGQFGAQTFLIDGRRVSRDLLDSAGEIMFLKRQVGIDEGSWNILDIGAGYGRLAYRLTETTGANVRVHATDAFPLSTFVSEYHLRFRGAERAKVVPLDEAEALLAKGGIDLATNIHSFSECTSEAIDWWTRRLAKAGVRLLMIIPNGRVFDGPTVCRTNDGRDMEAIFVRHGYVPVHRALRYADPVVQRYGVDPAQIALFELR